MRRVLVVFLKDTVYTVPGGAAQWHYTAPDSEQLREVILGSGALAVFMPDDENGQVNEHLGGARTRRVAFFPAGGWSGYTWEPIEEEEIPSAEDSKRQKAMAAAIRSGIAVPRAG